MKIRNFFKLLYPAFKEWKQDRAAGLAAGIAFYQILSIGPFFGLLIFILSLFISDQRMKAEIEPIISHFFHPVYYQMVEYLLGFNYKLSDNQLFTLTVIAIITLLWGTIGFFEHVKDSVEIFWNERRERYGFKVLLRKKTEAIFMSFVLLVILLAGVTLEYLLPDFIKPELNPSIGYYALIFVKDGIAVLILFFIFYFLLYYTPPVEISWKDVLPAAFLTTLLQLGGRLMLRNVLDQLDFGSETMLAAFFLLMVWFYYFAMVFLYCAEWNRIYIEKNKSKK